MDKTNDESSKLDDDKRLIKMSAFKELLGGVSDMSIRRWRQKFPDFPDLYDINGFYYVTFGQAVRFRDNRRKARAE